MVLRNFLFCACTTLGTWRPSNTCTCFAYVFVFFVCDRSRWHKGNCPATCQYLRSPMSCNDQALGNWPPDTIKLWKLWKDIFQLHIGDNFLSNLPMVNLKFIQPGLAVSDISGDTIQCSDVLSLESGGFTIFPDCPRGKQDCSKSFHLCRTLQVIFQN